MNSFDDFEDQEQQVFTKSEWQPKSPFGRFMKKLLKILKKAPKIIFFSLIVLVWVLIFAVMAFRSNDKIVDIPLLSDEARGIYASSPDDFTVYEIHTRDFMNTDGTIQLFTIVYAEDAGEVELGLRIKGHVGETLYCRLRDTNGNTYEQVFRRTRERDIKLTDSIRFQYVFERVAFDGVYIDVSKNIINRVDNTDYSAEASRFEGDIADHSAYVDTSKDDGASDDNALYFEIFASPESTEPLFSCMLYSDDIPLELVEYEPADEKYLSK